MMIPGILSQKGQNEREPTGHKIFLTGGCVPGWAFKTSVAPCFRGTPFQPPSAVPFAPEHSPQGQGDCTPSVQSSPFWTLIQERGLSFPIGTKSISRAHKDFFASLTNIPGVHGLGWLGQPSRGKGREEGQLHSQPLASTCTPPTKKGVVVTVFSFPTKWPK